MSRLLDAEAAVRIVARDPSRLDGNIREQIGVIEGSHDSPAVPDAPRRMPIGQPITSRARITAAASEWLSAPQAARILRAERSGAGVFRRLS